MAKKTNRLVSYFKEVKSELKKVVWPSFKQVKNNTLIVIACVLIIGAFIWICDGVFSVSFGKIINRGQEETQVEQQIDENSATEISPEEEAAYLEAMGVKVDENGAYVDIETGAELGEEELNARLEQLNAALAGAAETVTDTEATAE